MNRIRKGQPISGWLIIDKPQGMTSAQVVGKVRWLTKAQKVGHAGTLDPLATGVLPIALGEATKTVSFAMDHAKTYGFTVQWGSATDTDDSEGQPIRMSDRRPTGDEIVDALPGFTGAIRQMPPIYSALKVGGERAYDLARAGESFELQPRDIIVHSLTLVGLPDADHAVFEANVGKGCYIRSLARDIALALGTEGHITQLARLNVGKFSLAAAISLEKLAEVTHGARLDEYLAPVETALDDIPALALTDAEAQKLRQGQYLCWISSSDAERLAPLGPGHEGTALALYGGKPIALVEVSAAEIRPVRVLNL